MFNSYKKIQFIDYQDSYIYQQKRKKQRRKWLKLIILVTLLVFLITVIVPLAQSQHINIQAANLSLTETIPSQNGTNHDNNLIYSPQLIFDHPNNYQHIGLPIDINANVEISGLIAYTTIKQVFINPYAAELEGKYQFPLPENSAVKHLVIKIGDKEIVGQIMEKKIAKERYQHAKQQGKKASLVQQQRANLFTNHIANIPAHSTVVVTLTFIMPVAYSDGELAINLPLAMTTRYSPHQFQQSPAEITEIDNQVVELDVPDFNESTQYSLSHPFLTLNASPSNTLAKSQASIDIKLDAGAEISTIHSASHKINTKPLNNQLSQYLITLSKAQTLANKNFNLTWQLKPMQAPQISSYTEKVDDEHYTLLTFFPPQTKATEIFARDVIFIIDTSGSMQGASIAQAKHSLQQGIALLNNNDSFNIIAFNHTVDLLFTKTQMVNETTISQAHQFIDNLNADGGTEMYRPLSQALVMAKNTAQSTRAIRQVVFITDGAVANEFELMKLLAGAHNNFRLFTVGIGAAPNGYFMKKAAQFGRGSFVYIQNINQVRNKISALMTKISQPALSNIELKVDNNIHQNIEIYPKKIADLYLGEPMQVAIKSKHPITSIELTGDTAKKSWQKLLFIDDTYPSQGISSIWARNKIEDLLDGLVMGVDKGEVKGHVISVSLAHQIISPYTSFIAVEKAAEKAHESTLKKMNTAKNSHNSFMVAVPKTALGWQQQFLIGLILVSLGLLILRVKSK
ncbi:marine proteobacterial sortase target protein [Thalassotalea profundi]|uniref:Marine proteobacterial sortase target protein n=1 Tax=Thalassotalea profundi TaxID=2036687 RepID=A0ABQ3IMX9_9GAMM|nr:marine proteobacterial sortase target protein [Thalassotalea profundi]GHE85674.1 marine proteobacterial sortase target protein [Thalassotalea profundi]